MKQTLVLTVIGPDRTGLVEAVSAVVAGHEGNWTASHMARLAGQFAGILEVDVPDERADDLIEQLAELENRGLHVMVERVAEPIATVDSERMLRFELIAHDRPGIVRDVAHALAERRVNVVELETVVSSAPMTGEPLFKALVATTVPAEVDLDTLRDDLEALASDLDADIDFLPNE